MITALDIVQSRNPESPLPEAPVIDAKASVLDVMHRLDESPSKTLNVAAGEVIIGSISAADCLAALARIIVRRDDTALLEVISSAADYSASAITHAVEDADAHVVDFFSAPDGKGSIKVMIRILCDDPSAAIRNLERYGYEVADVRSRHYSDSEEFGMRILELQNYLNL